ncbi:MAG TPA: glycosyltransferase family 4 protein [Tepidisphaeraceae bacterium]|jgi:glycosyltransferase involved in cell wall biosynthesis
MNSILVITNNLSQASYRLRIEQLLAPLRQRGFELRVELRPKNPFARRKLLASAKDYDTVLLQRKLLDPSDAKLLRTSARRIVYDVDDAVMFDEKRRPGWRGRLAQWRISRRFDATASVLDCAVVGNEYLAGIFYAKTRNVIVLPTVVDPQRYAVKEDGSEARRHEGTEARGEDGGEARRHEGTEARGEEETVAEDDRLPQSAAVDRPSTINPPRSTLKPQPSIQTSPLTLVWIGSRSTLPYLSSHLPALEAASAELAGNLQLLIIADATLKSEKLKILHEPWSQEREAELLLRGDIGIAPTPLNHWTLGKCGFKIIQYMAAGLPVIASPVGANAQIVQHQKTGFHAETPADWTSHILTLARNPQLRQQMGQSSRQRVETNYSITRAVETWAQVLGVEG